jgi:hypothetical protein
MSRSEKDSEALKLLSSLSGTLKIKIEKMLTSFYVQSHQTSSNDYRRARQKAGERFAKENHRNYLSFLSDCASFLLFTFASFLPHSDN